MAIWRMVYAPVELDNDIIVQVFEYAGNIMAAECGKNFLGGLNVSVITHRLILV